MTNKGSIFTRRNGHGRSPWCFGGLTRVLYIVYLGMRDTTVEGTHDVRTQTNPFFWAHFNTLFPSTKEEASNRDRIAGKMRGERAYLVIHT